MADTHNIDNSGLIEDFDDDSGNDLYIEDTPPLEIH